MTKGRYDTVHNVPFSYPYQQVIPMYIDFHTHIFPDRIAPVTIPHLEKVGGIPAHTDGTASDLKRSMRDADIDLSIVLPVVTKPSQFDSINAFAAQINSENDRLLSFGGIHPDNDDIDEKLDKIVSLGLKGIKLHPDYQGVFIDDERYIRIIQGALDRGLCIVIHAGIDIGLPDPVHCSPERAAAMLDALTLPDKPLIVLAHTGGWRQWDDVERLLVERPVFFDISFSLDYIEQDQLLRIIRRHGSDRILFATDSPWGDQTKTKQQFEALPLSTQEQESIASYNAAKLLGL